MRCDAGKRDVMPSPADYKPRQANTLDTRGQTFARAKQPKPKTGRGKSNQSKRVSECVGEDTARTCTSSLHLVHTELAPGPAHYTPFPITEKTITRGALPMAPPLNERRTGGNTLLRTCTLSLRFPPWHSLVSSVPGPGPGEYDPMPLESGKAVTLKGTKGASKSETYSTCSVVILLAFGCARYHCVCAYS